MRKMLEELFYGNINPNEKRFIRNTDYDRAMQTLSENEDKLTDLLEGKEKSLFLDLVNAQSLINETTTLDFLSVPVQCAAESRRSIYAVVQ